jgi:hypothetical protein
MPPPRFIDLFKNHPPSQPTVATASPIVAETPATKEKSMSILGKIENGVKTLAHDAEAALALFVKDEPKIEAVAAATLKTVSPLVIAVVGVVSANPVLATATAATLSSIQTSLAAAQVVVVSLSSATSAKSLLQGIVSDLQTILTIVGVKDPALTATITSDVNKIVLALQVVIAAV